MPPPTTAAPQQHRTKRQFQPAITSYFHAAPDSFSNYDYDYDSEDLDLEDDSLRGGPRLRTIPQAKPHHATLAPSLPAQVQSDLLSVGMRVRKSVPEGYKTPKTVAPLQATSPGQTPLRKPHSAFRDTHPTLEIPHDTRALSLQHQRELLPFCGLNKIGGYAEQPTPYHLAPSNATSAFAQAFSQPFSSQDSGYGTDLQRARGKRGWSADDNDDHDTHIPSTATANFLFSIPNSLAGEEDVPVSPLSESPPPPSMPAQHQRPLAQPRSRRQRPAPADVIDVDMDMDFDSGGAHEGRLAAGHASDFEEADFLDGEVGMGGI